MKNDYLLGLMNEAFKPFIKPICTSCKFQKQGFETLCKQYKRKPPNAKKGYCEKYSKANRGAEDEKKIMQSL